MKIHKAHSYTNKAGTVVTIGTFDGVHIGHKAILKRLTTKAREKNLESLVLTFFPHPRMVLQHDADIKLLNTIDERASLLEKSGIDHLVVKKFTKEFSRNTALEYVRDLLVNTLKAKHIIIGYDHRFGRNRNANIEDLIEYGALYDFTVEEISAQDIDEVTVSSTKIRNALAKGNVTLANEYLGYTYMMHTHVVKGKGLGRQMDYPTANLELLEPYKLIPSNGVYVVKGLVNNQWVNGMMNIGLNPTVSSENRRHMEVHFFDFNEDIYNETVYVEFLSRVRDEQKFDSVETLKKQLTQDQIWAKKYLSENGY